MSDPTLDDLREVLRDLADHAVAPEVPLQPLEERLEARTRGRRRALIAVAAVAAVAATVLAITGPDLGGGSGNPSPATNPPSPTATPSGVDLPQGAAPKVAYTVGNELRYPGPDGERIIALGGRPSGLRQVGNTVMVTLDDNRIKVFELGAHENEALEAPAVGPGVLSPDGKYAAWQKPGSGKAQVILSRLDGSEVDRFQTFPGKPSCCDNPFNLIGITDDGRLIAWMGGETKTWIWDFAHGATSVVEVRELWNPAPKPGHDPGLGIIRQVVGNRVLVSYDDGGYDLGGFASDGLWKPENPDLVRPSFPNMIFGPDGSTLAYTGADSVWVSTNGIGHRLNLSSDVVASPWRFEDDQHLLVTTKPDDNGATSIVRCTVAGPGIGSCELAASGQGVLQLAD